MTSPALKVRALKACARCRGRKKKCDLRLPECTPCLESGAYCRGYNPKEGEYVPRSIVQSLEDKIARLQSSLVGPPSDASDAGAGHPHLLAKALQSLTLPGRGPFFSNPELSTLCLGPSAPPLSVSRHIESAFEVDNLPCDDYQPELGNSSSAQKGSFDLCRIPLRAINQMMQNYIDVVLWRYPVVDKDHLRSIFGRICPGNVENPLTQFELFIASLVLAISCASMVWKANKQAKTATTLFFGSAIYHLRLMSEMDQLARLQVLLLLAQYGHLVPEAVDIWACTANAVRIVLSLGLNRNPLNLRHQNTRLQRRLFMVTYDFDRSLSAMLRLPLFYPEESIQIMPERYCFTGIANQGASALDLVYQYRRIETEVHRILHLLDNTPTMQEGGGIDSWVCSVKASLDKWYSMCEKNDLQPALDSRHVMYHYLTGKIHRPTPRLPQRTPHDRDICFEACQNIVASVHSLLESKKPFYPFESVHILFGAAVLLLDECWETRRRLNTRNQAYHVLSVVVPQAIGLLEYISHQWKRARSCATCIKPILKMLTRQYGMAEIDAEEDLNLMQEDVSIDVLKKFLFADRLPSDDSSPASVFMAFEPSNFDDGLLSMDWAQFDDDIWQTTLLET